MMNPSHSLTWDAGRCKTAEARQEGMEGGKKEMEACLGRRTARVRRPGEAAAGGRRSAC